MVRVPSLESEDSRQVHRELEVLERVTIFGPDTLPINLFDNLALVAINRENPGSRGIGYRTYVDKTGIPCRIAALRAGQR